MFLRTGFKFPHKKNKKKQKKTSLHLVHRALFLQSSNLPTLLSTDGCYLSCDNMKNILKKYLKVVFLKKKFF